jgi:hypothetical protein
MARNLVSEKLVEKWSDKIRKILDDDSKFKRISESKLRSIAEMCNTRMLNTRVQESSGPFGMAQVGGIPGKGAFAFGNNPSAGSTGFYSSKGSGEAMGNLFGVFIEVVANTIGFDLLPMIPMQKSSGTIYIAEPIYADGKMDSATNKPLVIQVAATPVGSAPTLVRGTSYNLLNTGGATIVNVTYIGKDRLRGNFVFQIGTTDPAYSSATTPDLFDSATNGSHIGTLTNGWTFTAASVDYVAGFTNFIAGYSGAGLNDTDAWMLNRGDGTQYGKAMSRQTGEKTYYRSLGIRNWSRNYSAETVHVDIEYTTEQIQDMKMDMGEDAIAFGDSILQNELTQHINEHILGRIFALGWQNHYDMYKASGFNLNTLLDVNTNTGATRNYLGASDTLLSIPGQGGVLPSTGAIAENLSTIQRRIITRMLYGSGIINNRCRRGRGDKSVLNTHFASAIKDIRGYSFAPFPNDLNDGNLAHVGSLYGIDIYEDPMMDLTDGRISVFRKGNEKDPGAKFCPFILAEKIDTIAELTMAPKSALKSRYSIVEAGSQPQLNYLTFEVQEANGYSVV